MDSVVVSDSVVQRLQMDPVEKLQIEAAELKMHLAARDLELARIRHREVVLSIQAKYEESGKYRLLPNPPPGEVLRELCQEPSSSPEAMAGTSTNS